MQANTKTKKIILTSVFAFGAVIFLLFGFAVATHAQSIDFPTNFADLSQQNLKQAIENIVRIVLGLLGIVFLLLVLYGGLVWMTSQGEPDKINRAKKVIAAAVIGLLLTLTAYSIAGFIIRSLTGAFGPGGDGSSSSAGGPGSFGFALGAGALESHYPGRNAHDVPRNTHIFVTFKEAIDPTTFCVGDGTSTTDIVNINTVKVIDANEAVTPDALDSGEEDQVLDVINCSTTDNKTFKLDPGGTSTYPDDHLGRSNQEVLYRVELGPGIEKTDGTSALCSLGFPCSGYEWRFTVSSVVDETPPKVTSVYPNSGLVSRNSLVEITFSEPVDPSLTTGISPTFTNISLSDSAGGVLAGSYVSSNQYQSVDFISNEACGVNSCGGQVYCLPGGADIAGIVKKVIKDMAGNELDCGMATTCNATRDYIWNFVTTDDLDLDPPVMTGRVPGDGDIGADIEDPVAITFNERIAASSVRSDNVGFGRGGFNDPINYSVGKEDNIDTNGDGEADASTIYIYHEPYQPRALYHPGVDSNITDINQNCYFPAVCNLDSDPAPEPCP